MSQLKKLITEIHKRSLWQVLLIYVGGGWLVFEVVQTVTEGLGLPQWFPAFAALLLLTGLPVVLATAFVREGEAAATFSDPTLIPVEEGGSAAARRRRLLTWRKAGLSFMAALALWGVAAAGWLLFGSGAGGTHEVVEERPSVAVLPFVNRSGLEEDEYFTDGIHDQILTQLSKISGLSVRGRTSVMQYRESPKNLRQIGEELNARYLLEGGVLRAAGTVRINVQLIDAREDEHVWAETYDRALSVENLLAVQSEAARRVAEALRTTLTVDELERVEAKPTENVEAYEYFLRGNAHFRRRQLEREYYLAVQMYETAVELDPGFAEAWALIARARIRLYFVYGRVTELPAAEAAVNEALNLAPDLSEVQMALGDYYYYGRRDYDRALEHYTIVLREEPNNAEALASRAWIRRRQGDWEEAVAGLTGALEFDPQHDTYLFSLGDTYLLRRQYQEADHYFSRAMSLAPDLPGGHLGKVWLSLSRDGDSQRARQVLGETSQMIDPAVLLLSAELGRSLVPLALVRIFPDYFAQVLDGIAPATSRLDSAFYFLAKAQLGVSREETLAAHAFYDSARAVLEATVQEWPNEHRPHALLGLAYAGLGRAEDAIRHGKKGVELLPVSKDARTGPSLVWSLAEIEVTVGDYDSAIDRLDLLLSIPSEISVPVLRMDPIWDPLRDHPRFQALLE
jgi:serine/threonine-protein kinase